MGRTLAEQKRSSAAFVPRQGKVRGGSGRVPFIYRPLGPLRPLRSGKTPPPLRGNEPRPPLRGESWPIRGGMLVAPPGTPVDDDVFYLISVRKKK
jgi:hypothetical protein